MFRRFRRGGSRLTLTEGVQKLAGKYAGGDFEWFSAHRDRQVPMGRMGDAWDVAHAALFELSVTPLATSL